MKCWAKGWTGLLAVVVAALWVSSAMAADENWLNEFFGAELVKADGSKVAVDTLTGKKVGIYFSAHWCPPCRAFTPKLVEFYNDVAKDGAKFEIVFVSSDRDAKAMSGYMTEANMPWVALPFGDAHKQTLAKKYGIRGIPTLVIVDENGKTVTMNGRGDVTSKGKEALAGW